MNHTLKFEVEVVVEPDEDGFHACCPALKGLHVDGDTKEEALRNAQDAVLAYLDSLIKHGDAIPLGIIKPGTSCSVGQNGKPIVTDVHDIQVSYSYK
ncbi:MAG: type II toxin-antitoxin system HicB family antitoxin [Dehalococcoidia bacterium]|nr:type II toxin-antitoxin system HicB family antitoxin [Dehalococcoidia bacterium]